MQRLAGWSGVEWAWPRCDAEAARPADRRQLNNLLSALSLWLEHWTYERKRVRTCAPSRKHRWSGVEYDFIKDTKHKAET